MAMRDYKQGRKLVESIGEYGMLLDDGQYEALLNIMKLSLYNPENMEGLLECLDLRLAKIIITNYIGGYIMGNVTLGTTIEDAAGNTHTFYSAQFKDRDKIRELLPKVDSVTTITNMLSIEETGEFDEEPYEALVDLVRLSLRQPDADVEQWLDAKSARIAIRTLLDLPII
jgi:hypothetical protein